MSSRDFVRSLPGGSMPAVRRLNNMHLDPLLLAALLVVIAFGLTLWRASKLMAGSIVRSAPFFR